MKARAPFRVERTEASALDGGLWHNLSLVVFDLDDTLYPEADYVLSGFRAVAQWAAFRFDLPAGMVFHELSRLFAMGVRGNTFNLWLERRGLTAECRVSDMVEAYREHQPTLRPFTGVEALLASLGHKFQLALISDGYGDVQVKKFRALDLEHHFSTVVFTDQLGRDAWKPSPRAFALVLQQLAVRPEQAVYVADNPAKDFRAARAAGMKAIRFRHRQGLYRDSEPAGVEDAADGEVESVEELEEVLGALVSRGSISSE